MIAIDQAALVPVSTGGIYFLYNRAGAIIHVWNSSDVRRELLSLLESVFEPTPRCHPFCVPTTRRRTDPVDLGELLYQDPAPHNPDLTQPEKRHG
jgi:hypothetical protein